MIWMVRHCWPLGAIFALNCYQHEALLVVWRLAALCTIMTIRYRVTQGDPLSVVLYGLSFLPLEEAIRAADLVFLYPWY